MMLIPTTYFVHEKTAEGTPIPGAEMREVRITFDADKVSVFIDGDGGQTGVIFDNGNFMTINFPFDLLMQTIAQMEEEIEDEEPPPPRAGYRHRPRK